MENVRLPEVHGAVVDHVVDWLRSEKDMQRPPLAAAKLLILLVKLYRDHNPVPTRAAIATHLDIAVPTVDIVISNRIATGHLRLVTETARGHVKQRLTVVQHKFLIPSAELQAVVEAGEEKWKMLSANRRRVSKAPVDGGS